jgi:hypothetical protein
VGQLYDETIAYIRGDASQLPDVGAIFGDMGWDDFIIIPHASLQVPLDFTLGDAAFDAYLSVGVTNVSIVDIQSLEYAAGVHLVQPVDVGISTINIFDLQGSEQYNLNTGQKDDSLDFLYKSMW